MSTVHASAVVVGDRAVLIRGPSGSGKSRLAFALIMAARARQIPEALLVGDDRVDLIPDNDSLIVRGVPVLAGLIEIRGLGVRRCHHAAQAIVGLVVDLNAPDGCRMPPRDATTIVLGGIRLPRIPVAERMDALPLVLAALTTDPADCREPIGNHIEVTLTQL